MANYKAGDIIRMTRIASGISQEELCFGICSVETLSRIENGRHNVKKETYERLMMKMERIPEKNYAICTSDDMELLEEKTLLENALVKYDYKKAELYLKILKEKVSDFIVNEQYIRNTEALLDFYNHRINAEECVRRLEDALRLTAPGYDKFIDKIYPFTEQELRILMRLANSYARIDEFEKSISIYQMILRCLDEGYMIGKNVKTFQIVVMRNYANTLALLDKFKETIDLLKEIYDLSLKYNYGSMIPIILDDMAWTEMQIDKLENCYLNIEDIKNKKRQAYYIAAARNDNNIKKIIKETFEESFKEKITLF